MLVMPDIDSFDTDAGGGKATLGSYTKSYVSFSAAHVRIFAVDHQNSRLFLTSSLLTGFLWNLNTSVLNLHHNDLLMVFLEM